MVVARTVDHLAITARFFADYPPIRKVIAMRAVVFLVALWITPFLFFGWRVWATWPSQHERERQHEISKLCDHHFKGRRARAVAGSPRLSHNNGRGAPSRGYTETNSIAL